MIRLVGEAESARRQAEIWLETLGPEHLSATTHQTVAVLLLEADHRLEGLPGKFGDAAELVARDPEDHRDGHALKLGADHADL